jgi:integrase
VLGASWAEIDFEAKVWTIPPPRMKSGRQHRVPLSPQALAILDQLRQIRSGDFVFPSPLRAKPLSNMAMEMLLRRMKADAITVHGFRSSFRDWCGEETDHPRELAEAALAHAVGDTVERAYRRGDALEKRRELMDVWTDYAGSPGR